MCFWNPFNVNVNPYLTVVNLKKWWGRLELNQRPLPGTVNSRPYGFLLAPESRHPRLWSANPLLISGALNGWYRLPVRLSSSLSSALSKDRAWLDYGPLPQEITSSQYIRFLNNKRNLKKPKSGECVRVAGHRVWDPPDPIPNSEVKPRSVSGVSVVFGHVKPGKLAIHFPNIKSYSRQIKVSNYFFVWTIIFFKITIATSIFHWNCWLVY